MDIICCKTYGGAVVVVMLERNITIRQHDNKSIMAKVSAIKSKFFEREQSPSTST